MKIAFIATVLNEEENIEAFLSSLFIQTKKPNEIIIVDGGSRDNTLKLIKKHKPKVTIIQKKGNRSIGRNTAIKHSKSEIIAISDAGCILDKNWLKNITASFEEKETFVVAGYYKSLTKTIFQKCLVPYVLVMPDRINPKSFLPATRSMAFRKEIWEEMGGFDERLSNNEDYAFSRKIKDANIPIRFKKNAIVYWIPRENIRQAFEMFFRFAKGDIQSKILRLKVILIFLRYIFGIILVFLILQTQNILLLWSFIGFIFFYLVWAIGKNYKYVKDPRAILYLPVLQFVSDIAVIFGTISGFTAKVF